MKNWRATIGLILPGAGITAEYDFNKYAPDGVGICTTRIPFGKAGVGPTPENLKLMVQGLESGCLRPTSICRWSPAIRPVYGLPCTPQMWA